MSAVVLLLAEKSAVALHSGKLRMRFFLVSFHRAPKRKRISEMRDSANRAADS